MRNSGILLLLHLLLSPVITGNSRALEVTADSCAVTDIQSAADEVEAAGGGTVYIPEGNCEHSSEAVKIPDGISLIGAGQDKTLISNGNVKVNTRFYGKLDKPFRISGINFSGDSHLSIDSAHDFRIDAITIENGGGTAIGISRSSSAVIDHCTVKVNGSYYGVTVTGSYDEFEEAWEPDVENLLGQSSAIFIEDSYFEGSEYYHAVVGHGAAHYVFRYNTVLGAKAHEIDTHGPGYGPPCGTRLVEAYNNTFQNLGFGHKDRCPCDWENGNDHCCEVFVWDIGSHPGMESKEYIREDEHYFLRAPSQELDGFVYTPYTYPHPLTSDDLSSTTTISSDTSTTTVADHHTTTTMTICPLEKVYGKGTEEVALMRYFRDKVLSQTPAGQELIRLYYEWSPAIIKAISQDTEFKEEIKELIDEALLLIEE